MRAMQTMLLTAAAAAALPGAAAAQEALWTREGIPPPYTVTLTGPLAVIGDIDRDGYPELVQVTNSIFPFNGLWFFSGKDGATLRIRPYWIPGAAMQTVVGAGDVDADGIEDYAVGLDGGQATAYVNRVQVFSARDDRMLWEALGWSPELYGWHIAGDLDVDGDKKPDLLVGASRGGSANWPYPGAISVYSNKGALLYTITNLPGIWSLGRSLAKVGDVDADGCDDFVGGALENGGVVLLFSGKTGKLLHKVYGESDGTIGWSVTGCGDIDGDGVPDFAGGTNDGFGECGLVRAYSGKTGKTLYSWRNPRNQCQAGFGGQIRGGRDFDLDGVLDLVVVNADYDYTTSGSLGVYSGRDGSRFMLHRIENAGGQNLITLPPEAGNPFPRYACNAMYVPQGHTIDVGRLTMYRARPSSVEPYGLACQGNQPGAPRIGIRAVEPKATRIHLSGGEPGGIGVLLAGVSRTSWGGWPLPFPLSQFGFPGCVLLTSVEAAMPVTLGTSGLAAGYGSVDIPLPLAYYGVPLHGQWLTLRPGTNAPGGASDALLWRH